MALDLTLADLRDQTVQHAGWGLEYEALADRERTFINATLESAYSQYLYPESGHSWTFLQPTIHFPLSSGVRDYELPEEFGGIAADKAYYSEDDNTYHDVTFTSPRRIDAERQISESTVTAYPLLAAVDPLHHTGTGPQRFRLMVWPTPGGDGTLKMKIHLMPAELSDDKPFPHGGKQHRELLLEACFAVHDERHNEHLASGVHRQRFNELLAQAILRDAGGMAAKNLGYNGNARRHAGKLPGVLRHRYVAGVTYKGEALEVS